jgi:hypothetical protein
VEEVDIRRWLLNLQKLQIRTMGTRTRHVCSIQRLFEARHTLNTRTFQPPI